MQTVAVQNLFNQMQQLEQKISEAKAKKDQLKARAQTAKVSLISLQSKMCFIWSMITSQVSTKINDMMSRSSSAGALEAFNRMQDKVTCAVLFLLFAYSPCQVERMEAEAEVARELSGSDSSEKC